LFAWRAFANQRQLGACAGLTPTPYSSGDRASGNKASATPGIEAFNAGNDRIELVMVAVPTEQCPVARQFQKRFAGSCKAWDTSSLMK
ncbi:MAG: hypothetical protein ACRERV_01010, partial [Methylococcales bacterium]